MVKIDKFIVLVGGFICKFKDGDEIFLGEFM